MDNTQKDILKAHLRSALMMAKNLTVCDKTDLELIDIVADQLLLRGVVVPPCKVGDKVYWVENNTEIKSGKVRQFGYENHIWLVIDVSKTKCVVLNEERGIFLTKEEAEKALRSDTE